MKLRNRAYGAARAAVWRYTVTIAGLFCTRAYIARRLLYGARRNSVLQFASSTKEQCWRAVPQDD
eukprot:2987082-Rhodomonas_salina.1